MNWKRKLNRELDGIVPPYGDALPAPARPARRRFGWMAAVAAVLVLAVVLPFLLPIGSASACVAVEINPKVVFVVKGGKVQSCVALNEDADVVLSYYGLQQKLCGQSVEEAVSAFADTAAKLGYVDMDDVAAARISGTDKNKVQSVSQALSQFFAQKGVYAVAVQNFATVSEISDIIGQNVRTFAAQANKISPVYSQRSAPKDARQAEEYYRTHYLFGEVKQTVQLLVQCFMQDILDFADGIADQLMQFVEYVSDEVFESVAHTVVSLLQRVWQPAEAFFDLLELPNTLEQFYAKVQEFLSVQAQIRERMFAQAYEQAREALSQSQVQSFLQDVIAQYGSEQAYWQSVTQQQ